MMLCRKYFLDLSWCSRVVSCWRWQDKNASILTENLFYSHFCGWDANTKHITSHYYFVRQTANSKKLVAHLPLFVIIPPPRWLWRADPPSVPVEQVSFWPPSFVVSATWRQIWDVRSAVFFFRGMEIFKDCGQVGKIPKPCSVSFFFKGGGVVIGDIDTYMISAQNCIYT